MLNFDFYKKGQGLVSPSSFEQFFKKDVSHVIFYILTKFHYLIAFTSCDVINFEINLVFLSIHFLDNEKV